MKNRFKVINIIILVIIIGIIINGCASTSILLMDQRGNKIIGSLAEKNFTEIGGIRQGYFVRSEDPENPVILFLHGGPGSPSLPFQIRREIPERIEKYFTVVYWEQRGAGISFSTSIDPATMTLDQLVEDTRQMTEYLQHRFGQERIFLMGHSWGSYLGIKTIGKHPEYYFAYIGIAQITNQIESERLAYDFMLQYAKERGDRRSVRNLQRFDRNAPEFPCLTYFNSVRSRLMNKFGIGMARNENLTPFRLGREVLFFNGYTFSEKINYQRGRSFSVEHLWNYDLNDNLFESSVNFAIPVFIIHGKWDYMVSYTLSREWFEKINAPKKGFANNWRLVAE